MVAVNKTEFNRLEGGKKMFYKWGNLLGLLNCQPWRGERNENDVRETLLCPKLIKSFNEQTKVRQLNVIYIELKE